MIFFSIEIFIVKVLFIEVFIEIFIEVVFIEVFIEVVFIEVVSIEIVFIIVLLKIFFKVLSWFLDSIGLVAVNLLVFKFRDIIIVRIFRDRCEHKVYLFKRGFFERYETQFP